MGLTPSFTSGNGLHLADDFKIGFGAGGSTDTMGRVIAKVMKEQTGWNVVVENKPGGGGVAMFTKVAKSKPNGQVVGMGVSTPILMQLVLRPEKMAIGIDDFDYIATVARGELAVVARSDAPFNDLESMVKYAKANGPLKMALNAKPGKFVLNAVARKNGIKFQYVTTKGGAESMKLLMGKRSNGSQLPAAAHCSQVAPTSSSTSA